MLSEITKSQAKKHNNSFEINGDVVQLRDPFTGENLSSERPPQSLEFTAGLAGGFEYLKSRDNLTVRLYGESHADEHQVNKDELLAQLAMSDAVFLELVDHTPATEKAFWDVSMNGGAEITAGLMYDMGPHKFDQLNALVDANKPVFLPEPSREGTQYDQEINEYMRIIDKLLPVALSGGDEGIVLAAEIAVSASTMMRDWYMIGKMGQQIELFEEKTGIKITNPMIWIGSVHTDTLQPKLEALGITTSVAIESTHGYVSSGEAGERSLPKNGSISMVDAARNGLARISRR